MQFVTKVDVVFSKKISYFYYILSVFSTVIVFITKMIYKQNKIW